MKREAYNNSMRLETYDLQKFAGQLYELNQEKVNTALTTADYMMAKKVIAVGCGDSFCASYAAQGAFKALVGVPMIGCPAIEISRCYDQNDLDNVLFFGISSRGRTARVIEAAARVNELATAPKTVAVVNFVVEKSQLEETCHKSMYIQMPTFDCGEYTEHAPCQRSYFSTMFTMMLQAIKMGEARGNYSAQTAQEYRDGMIAYAQKFDDKLLADFDERMWQLAQKWNEFRQFEVVGSGSDAPNTWVVAAKVVEAFGDIATYETPENWLAVNQYAKNPEKIGTVVVLDAQNEAFDYTVKVIEKMVKINRPVIVLTDAPPQFFPEGAHVFTLPTCEYRWAKPLMQYCPVGLIFGYIKEMRGVSFYRYGGECDDEKGTMREKLDASMFDLPLQVIREMEENSHE